MADDKLLANKELLFVVGWLLWSKRIPCGGLEAVCVMAGEQRWQEMYTVCSWTIMSASASGWKHCLPFTDRLTCMGFPGGSDGKESACRAGELGLILGSGRTPGEGNGNPLQYSRLENLCGQRSLAGCSPWSHKELDTPEWLTLTCMQIEADIKWKRIRHLIFKAALWWRHHYDLCSTIDSIKA